MPIARIDGDLCAFAVSAACEGRKYRYKGQVYDSKLELNKILKRDGVDDSAIEFFKEPESPDKVKTSAISYIENIIEKTNMDYQVYLSGKSNHRYEIATILPYKGNRTGIERPEYLDFVRQLYVDLYDAKVSVGMEADDAIGLAHDIEFDVIVTRDKDLNCIPGEHYDWEKDTWTHLSYIDSDRHFYKQVLTGDPTDNILGLYGVGKDSKLVKDLNLLEDDKRMYDHVLEQYVKRFGNYGKQFMIETCHLVWILQQREQLWRTYIGQI